MCVSLFLHPVLLRLHLIAAKLHETGSDSGKSRRGTADFDDKAVHNMVLECIERPRHQAQWMLLHRCGEHSRRQAGQ